MGANVSNHQLLYDYFHQWKCKQRLSEDLHSKVENKGLDPSLSIKDQRKKDQENHELVDAFDEFFEMYSLKMFI